MQIFILQHNKTGLFLIKGKYHSESPEKAGKYVGIDAFNLIESLGLVGYSAIPVI